MSSSIDVNAHGGNCCGICHIYDLTGESSNDCGEDPFCPETFKKVVENNYRERDIDGSSRLLEVVVTDLQMENNPDIQESLDELGFRYVSKFRNINSGNICRIYHKYKSID